MQITDALEGKDDDLYRTFDQVFVYIANNDALEPLLGCKYTNVEDVFGLLDLEARVLPPSRKIREALLRVILETLERTITTEKKQPFVISGGDPNDLAETTSTPLQMLVSLVADRVSDNSPNTECRMLSFL